MDTLQDWSNVATIVGSVVGATALVFAAYQLRHAGKVAEGQFLLELEGLLSRHDIVLNKLRPGGDWSQNETPQTTEEWSLLEDYMGFFEHCELLIQDGSLSLKRFEALFSYRLHNIVANKSICNAKFGSQEREHWSLFFKICDRVGANYES